MIRIVGSVHEQHLEFVIADNGIGMEPSRLEQVLKPTEGPAASIGIRNVNERIKLFGGEYGIRIKSELSIGTEVTVVLPKLT